MVERFVASRWNVPVDRLEVRLEALSGGLESRVALAEIVHRSTEAVPRHLIVKELRGHSEREPAIYRALWQHLGEPPSPRLFGEEVVGDRRYLYLEAVLDRPPWPWAEAEHAAAVCRELARLHHTRRLPRELFAWDYEPYLRDSAVETMNVARLARDGSGARYWTRMGDLRRVVDALPALRSRLLASETVVLHGDVHPGNVMLEPGGGTPRVTLIDWSRARVGAPMEDVASWLHSLGCWEPQARRRHDTLVRAYLAARGSSGPLSHTVRRDYWFASVSNGLAGAIRFHLLTLADAASSRSQRYNSSLALQAWTRVVRRAALLSTSGGRYM
jgi:aminoglycoside phosphotransferase